MTGRVGIQDVRGAAERTADYVHRTGMAGSKYLSTLCGAQVTLKLELFQKTGSFKVRGVLNTLLQLDDAQRRAGVIGMSAGNHAQALAWGATLLGIESTVVMPAKAARSKVEATRGYGARVVLTDGDLVSVVADEQGRTGATLVHPVDDPRVIAGQGTVGLEIVSDMPAVDLVLVGCGGGGLLAGVAVAVKALAPHARVVGVEPEGSNVMTRSLAAGAPARLTSNTTIADGLAPPFTGEVAFALVRDLVDEVVLVSDREILQGTTTLMERCKLFAEPAAGAAIAPLLTGAIAVDPGSRVVPIVCGGNMDLGRLRELLS